MADDTRLRRGKTAVTILRGHILGPSAVFVVFFAYYLCHANALIDDALISLAYARNLYETGSWGIVEGYPSNTATSALNVVLGAAAIAIVHNGHVAVALLSALEASALWLVLIALSRQLFGRRDIGIVAFVAISLNILLLSTIGLESLLYVLLLFTATLYLTQGRVVALAAVCALLVLTRPDGVIAFAVACILAPIPEARANEEAGPGASRAPGFVIALLVSRLKMGAIFFAVLAPWLVYSIVEFGVPVPDTLFFKAGDSWGRYVLFQSGYELYLERYPIESGFAVGLAVFAPLLACCRSSPVQKTSAFLGLFVALYIAGYSALRTAPYHWYYVPVVLPAVALGVFGLGCLSSRFPRVRWLAMAVGLGVPVVGVADYHVREAGITPMEAPIHTNWAPQMKYEEIAEWINGTIPRDARVLVKAEYGTLAYYAVPRLFNSFSCRSVLVKQIGRRLDANKLPSFVTRLASDLDPGRDCGPYEYTIISRNGPLNLQRYGNRVVKSWRFRSRWTKETATLAIIRQTSR